MRFPWVLVVKNFSARPLRTLLTVASLTVAFFLLCVLNSVLGGLEAGIKASANDRLVVQSAVSLFVSLPDTYREKIKSVAGVDEAIRWQWFGGIYKERSNFFAQFAVDHDQLLSVYPEIEIDEPAEKAFMATRTGCLIGRQLAEKYGFRVGDRVPLQGTIFPRIDGRPWELEVVGVYRSTSANVDENTMFFRYDYLDETRKAKVCGGPPGAGVYVLDLDGRAPEAVAARIDAMFMNGPQAVNTTSEAEFQRQFVTMLGSVPILLSSIGGGVLFAILLAVINTMLMAGRERTHDFGILKALGFHNNVVFALLLLESVGLCLVGGGLGVLLAVGSEGGVGKAVSMVLPTYSISTETQLLALGAALALGLLAGILPGLQARRLEVVEALRAEV